MAKVPKPGYVEDKRFTTYAAGMSFSPNLILPNHIVFTIQQYIRLGETAENVLWLLELISLSADRLDRSGMYCRSIRQQDHQQ